MTRDDLARFYALDIDFGSLGLAPWGEYDVGYFCTPEDAHCFASTGVGGVHYCLLPGDERVYVVRPDDGEVGTYVLPVGGDFRAFLSYLCFCGGETALEQLASMDEAGFRAHVAEGFRTEKEDPEWGAARNRAREAIRAAFGLEPVDPYGPVKRLQAEFDPAALKFSEEYYDVLGLERP